MALDDQTLAFMRKHSIAEADVYEAGLLPRSQWQLELKRLGKRFAYSSPCKRGHRLRNRHGACLVCQPQSIGFEKHHRSGGIVYVAFSDAKRLVKIGGETTGEDRAKTLNRQSYGGASDWRIVHRQRVEEVGRVEAVAQATVKDFQVPDQVYRGDQREARELFNCSWEVAREAVKQAAAAHAPAR